METSTTGFIVEALTKAIVEHRLQPGSKLAEQKLADHFGVSRTLVRQALFQLVAEPPDHDGARTRRLRGRALGGGGPAGICRAPHAGGRDDTRLHARSDPCQAAGAERSSGARSTGLSSGKT
ncbi:MAG: GntR family transcriptional regulator [Comamonadaceae bacterium]|nr:GntR family transcriptional regulator [Comamonadaceae bacterium]